MSANTRKRPGPETPGRLTDRSCPNATDPSRSEALFRGPSDPVDALLRQWGLAPDQVEATADHECSEATIALLRQWGLAPDQVEARGYVPSYADDEGYL